MIAPIGNWLWRGLSNRPIECRYYRYLAAKGRCHGNHFLAFYILGAHCRHLANTTELSICGGDAALCQIILSTCYNTCTVVTSNYYDNQFAILRWYSYFCSVPEIFIHQNNLCMRVSSRFSCMISSDTPLYPDPVPLYPLQDFRRYIRIRPFFTFFYLYYFPLHLTKIQPAVSIIYTSLFTKKVAQNNNTQIQ